MILPLPGRSHKSGQLVPSLPAPAASNNPKRAVEREVKAQPKILNDDFEEDLIDETPVKPPPTPKVIETKASNESLPLSIWKVPPEPDSEEELQNHEFDTESPVEMPTAAEKAARRQLSRDRARIIGQAFPSPSAVPAPFRPPPLPSLPAKPGNPCSITIHRFPPVAEEPSAVPSAVAESVLNPKSVTALALAALLGCLVDTLLICNCQRLSSLLMSGP